MAAPGFEPGTHGFSIRCSTNQIPVIWGFLRGKFRVLSSFCTYIALTKDNAMKITLTQSTVHKAIAKPKPYEMRDDKLIGFLVRIQPSGLKTYYCEYRRGARVKIGSHSVFDTKSARLQAKDILASY